MRQKILNSVEDAIRAVQLLRGAEAIDFIEKVTHALVACFKRGGKVLVAGNGGSLCDAMHFAEELTGLYRNKRPALGAIALSDPGHMSCVANDMGYDFVFSRAVEALGRPGDVLVVLTTSGNSTNLMHALEAGMEKGMTTVAFLGRAGVR